MKEKIGNLNEVRAIMVFLVMTMDDQFEVEFDVSCGEDIENYMKLYKDVSDVFVFLSLKSNFLL
ncbi:hypothetical protein ACQVTS_28520 [Bacillus mycoides]|uniref:hypothetical protein n=1 Tax=Bacillus mycoides TaxID=1405 RepID=UPI003D65AF81